MSENSKLEKLVLDIKQGNSGILCATSHNLKALFAVGKNQEELFADVAQAVSEIFQFENTKVTIIGISKMGDGQNWELSFYRGG